MSLAVLHVDCSSAYGLSSQQQAEFMAVLLAGVRAAGYEDDLHVVPLYDVFTQGTAAHKEQRLLSLLQVPAHELCMCVCACMLVGACDEACVHASRYVCVCSVCVCAVLVCVCVKMRVPACWWARVKRPVCMPPGMCVCVYLCECLLVHVCVCV